MSKSGKVLKKFSNPKRYSYLLGKGAKLATPYKFLGSGAVKNFDDLQKRFSVEVVNDEFYQGIASMYDRLVGAEFHEALLKYPSSGESAHQFAVRLIGRIVFCWFLREKKSLGGKPLIDKSILSEDAVEAPNYYHEFLAPLFFEVLNKPIGKRHDNFKSGTFGDTPYLNGGLFSAQHEDHYKFDSLIGKSVPGLVDVPDGWIKEFFKLLELYHFTVDENTSVDIDLSIDPEMLGRIFENLLARINPETGESVRKSTGSFYTPREIVEYMVDESLIQYLITKTSIKESALRALISYDLDDDTLHPRSEDENIKIVQALNTIKIFDPACGSGAFPIGALQKVVFILQQVDKDCSLWIDEQLRGASPELRRQLQEQSYDYVRKLGVIRTAIFGVDIQPIATEIARLRCFLTLIVDENVDDSADNRGIKVLPNLDFKFVTANTLINAPSSQSNDPSLFDTFEEQLESAVNEYFSAEGIERAELAHKLRDLIDNKVNENKSFVLNNAGIIKDERFIDAYNQKNSSQNMKLLREASIWDSYKNIFSHKAISFYETKYIFPSAKEGFDIVIGNPPYISALSAIKIIPKEVRADYKKTYKSAKGAYDMYLLFFEKGIDLLNRDGLLCYISPTKYVSAKYAQAFRTEVGMNKISKVAHFSNSRVFSSAGVSTFVSFMMNNRASDSVTTEVYESSDMSEKVLVSNSTSSLEEFPENSWGHLLSSNYGLLSKIYSNSVLLSSVSEVNGSSTAAEADLFSGYIKNEKTSSSLKIVNTGTISCYFAKWGSKEYSNKKTKILEPYLTLDKVGARRIEMYRSPKIIISKLSKNMTAMLDYDGEFASTNTTFVYSLNDKYPIEAVVAILNSKLMNFVYKTLFSGLNLLGSFQFQAPQIRLLPVPESMDEACLMDIKEIINIARSTSSFDNESETRLNQLVYKMYNLSNKEIEIIESF
ncbi:Eco57I restriction-modification methylase domain-containing protein [Candidatus Woesebacteria bacterium]|nr:Eco57I restriction-modification methylase domain-containing protein [Candidatus Woesebacteria bacterium]